MSSGVFISGVTFMSEQTFKTRMIKLDQHVSELAIADLKCSCCFRCTEPINAAVLHQPLWASRMG